MHGSHDHKPLHGHNRLHKETVQWQTPHQDHHHHHDEEEVDDEKKDFDLVEQAFVETFASSSDPTSYLRLVGIPFRGQREDGTVLNLLRVEQQQVTDVGSITPHVGGGSFNYAPLPAKMTSRRNDLVFVYHDGTELVKLTLQEAKELKTE